MKKQLLILLSFALIFYSNVTKADVTYSTESVPAATIAQGQADFIVYIAKMDVTGTAVTANNINFILTGMHNASDIASIDVLVNTTPSATGATFLVNNTGAAFASPHTYNFNFGGQIIPAGETRYFIIRATLTSDATHGNNLKIDGSIPANAVNIGFTTSPTETNNQTDGGGLQTFQAAGIIISSESVTGGFVPQGTTGNIVYIAKVEATGLPITINSISNTILGTIDNNDFSARFVYMNTTPTIGGTIVINNQAANLIGGQTYNSNISPQTILAGETRYFIYVFNVAAAANNGNTFEMNGATNPVSFGYTTAPTVTNSQTDASGTFTIQAAGVTISSEPVTGSFVPQGTTGNIVYIAKVEATGLPITINSISNTILGTIDNNDFSARFVYMNTTPTIGGTIVINNQAANLIGGQTYNSNISPQTILAGETRYFIYVFNVAAAANNGNTFEMNGATNPVSFGYTTAPTVTNSQTDASGTFTIQAAGVTISSEPVTGSFVPQGTTGNIVYIAKVEATGLPITINSISNTILGTIDNNDFSARFVYMNTTPTIGGTIVINNQAANLIGGQTYNSNISPQTILAGETRYFIYVFNVAAAANNGNTFEMNGATNPVSFGYTTAPTVTNSQTDASGTFTIQAAGVTISSEPVTGSFVPQGTTGNIVYIAKVEATGLPITINSISNTILGTIDNNDLSARFVYMNTTPTIGGTIVINNQAANLIGGQTYNSNISPQTIPAGETRYFIYVFNVAAAANNGNTFEMDGATNPVSFGYSTAPTVTNNQTDIAGTFTIQAPGVTLSSLAVAGATVPQGSTGHILYIAKMDVTGLPVTISSVNYTLGGNVDNNDLSARFVYFNTAPTLTGATPIVNNQSVGFAAPHTFNTNISNQTIPAGETRYFLYVFNVANAANNGNIFEMDGFANPVSFGFTTSPTVTNNQTNESGTFTIQSAGVTISSEMVTGGSASQNSGGHITYIAKVVVSGLPVSINAINYTLGGNVDNNDLSARFVYMNTTPTIGGIAVVNNQGAGFASPHTYNTNINQQTIPAGETRYFVFTFNVAPTGTNGNMFEMDGAANPISFNYSTAPTVTNSQTDMAGFFTIGTPAVTISTIAVPAGGFMQGSNDNILYIAKMDVTNLPTTVTNINFTLTGTHDANDMSAFRVYANDTPDLVTPTNTLGGNGNASFAAPHTYNQQLNGTVVNAEETKYFIITVNLNTEANSDASAKSARNTVEIGNTIILDGAANPVVFGFNNGPVITNNQSNLAPIQTISSALPVTLISFSGKNLGENKIELTWKTDNERNFDHFEIQRSSPEASVALTPGGGISNVKFEKIGEKKSNESGNYEFRDSTPPPGAGGLYYRLKMIDLDGSFSYSKIIKVAFENKINQIIAYPNPTIDYLKIDLQSTDNEIVTLLLINNSGKIIETKSVKLSKGINQINWNTQSIAAGNYFISENNNKFSTKRFLKQ